MTISMRDVRIMNLPRGNILEAFIDRMNVQLKGELKVVKAAAGTAQGAKPKDPILSGRVELKLRAELPQILLSVPGLQQVIDGGLLHSLTSLESELTGGIVKDYHLWATSKAEAEAAMSEDKTRNEDKFLVSANM